MNSRVQLKRSHRFSNLVFSRTTRIESPNQKQIHRNAKDPVSRIPEHIRDPVFGRTFRHEAPNQKQIYLKAKKCGQDRNRVMHFLNTLEKPQKRKLNY